MRTYFRWNHQLTRQSGTSWALNSRLMALGVVSTMYGLVPTSISIVLLAMANPVTPWPGWRTIHSTIDVIVHVSAREWEASSPQAGNVELRRWTIVTLAFMVFVFLGTTADVRKMYWTLFRRAIEQTFSTGQAGCDLVGFEPDFRSHDAL